MAVFQGDAMFCVYWDKVIRRVHIHRADCSACQTGVGEEKLTGRAGRGVTYSWEHLPTYAESAAKSRPT